MYCFRELSNNMIFTLELYIFSMDPHWFLHGRLLRSPQVLSIPDTLDLSLNTQLSHVLGLVVALVRCQKVCQFDSTLHWETLLLLSNIVILDKTFTLSLVEGFPSLAG